jgi:uncharacterized protein (DUF2252 family)
MASSKETSTPANLGEADARRFFDWGGRESHDPELKSLAPATRDRITRGKQLRKDVPRSAHGKWKPEAQRPDPIAILEQQAAVRVPDLVPIRYGRMLESPFAFFRGGAAIMAWDLAHSATTRIRVQCCGDAHLVNFGAFAAPDRRLIFDLNDFDETLPAPFDWDLKRLAASVEIAARDNNLSGAEASDAVRASVRAYQQSMAMFGGLRFLDTWYARIDLDHIEHLVATTGRATSAKQTQKEINKAKRKTSVGALARFAEEDGTGSFRIKEDLPTIVRFGLDTHPHVQNIVNQALKDFSLNLQPDRRALLERYHVADFARKVVGVGSVGTEAFMMLLMGDRDDDPLFLQLKEAQQSVLEPYAGASIYANHGERVVQGQRLMQAASDSFLGWITGTGPRRLDYYVRQMRDMKGSADVATMDGGRLAAYAELCGATLARAHARAGDAAVISGYVGTGDAFADSIVAYSTAYADCNEEDHARLVAAVNSGRVVAETGV